MADIEGVRVDCGSLNQFQVTGIHNKLVYTGTMHSILGEPRMQWAILQD